MCDFDENCTPGIILETEYTAMELTDLTGNGAKDLLLITSDTSGKRVARLYQYDNGSMLPAGETATSQGTAAVERMQSGRVQDSKTAVFAEEKVANGAGLTTDIFVYSNDTLRNLALDGEDTASHSTYRPVAVYASDVNGDGITELPRAVLMAGYNGHILVRCGVHARLGMPTASARFRPRLQPLIRTFRMRGAC